MANTAPNIESVRDKLIGRRQEAPSRLVMELKPSLTPAIASMCMVVALMLIIVAFIFAGNGMRGEGVGAVILIVLGPILLIALVPGIISLLKTRTRRYNIYSDRAEWYEGFITIKKRSVPLTRVTDIISRRGILDRICGTGTIGISTAGSVYFEIVMDYVRDTDRVYNNLRELWKAQVSDNPPEF